MKKKSVDYAHPVARLEVLPAMLFIRRGATLTTRVPAELKLALEAEAQEFAIAHDLPDFNVNDYVILKLCAKEGK